ncbi:hypothetical protein V6N12_002242 [Hibiscus sabdariffa]|uniref:NAD-dependent epimerase/dehydratase domain-containing protein n=1 Tax=Hibiscus sabdariffa TaxID=183260 RepID=A0ABR2B1L6_9ROSI
MGEIDSFFSNKSAKIFVAGHRGLVGSAIVPQTPISGLHQYFTAKVGGIHANNTYPADFISINLQIQTNVIDSSYRHGVKKILFLGSSCIYPKFAPQPIPENALLSGPLEPTNEWYAVAKIAGIKMCQAYRIQHGFDAISAMPTNLYGPNDNFHPENSPRFTRFDEEIP